jgi:ElaB/YqjD/DUF883 family membrane-anchored ribosome-binding protein
MDTPQIDDVLIFAGQVSAAIIAISGALFIIRKTFFKRIADEFNKIYSELRPNGGTSLRDAVNRIEENQHEIKQESREIRNKIDDHINWHLDK